MKTFLYALVAGMLAWGFLSCNGNTDAAPSANPVQAGPGTITGQSAPRPVVKLLTFRLLKQDQDILRQFEETYSVRVEATVRPMRDIVADAVAGRAYDADVLIVPTLEDAVRLRDFRMLQPFFVDAFTNGDVGDQYLDNEGYWAGLTRWAMVSVYNPNAVTKAESSTYKSIIQTTARNIRVGVAHPDSSGLAAVVAGLYADLNPGAAQVWAKLMYDNSEGGPQGSDYDQLNRMLAGELDMAFVSMGACARWMLNGDPLHFKAGNAWRVNIPTAEASGNNYTNMTCITMPANAPNRALADKLINFYYQKEVQEKLSSAWFEFPCQTFSEADSYLYNFPGGLGSELMGEQLDQNIPNAWSIINQVAQQSR